MATKKIQGDLRVKNNVQIDNGLSLPAKTASRALQLDGSGNVESSAVTTTELGHLSGVTSALQTQLDAKIPATEKGAANGVATLDGAGKLTLAQIPDTVIGSVDYKGTWDANTNSPDLGALTPDKGDYYVVNVAGTTSLGGITDWQIGDWAIYNGTAWEKVDNTDQVSSVFGRQGTVTAQSGDYSSDLITYDNTLSGLTATDVKAAIDELDSNIDAKVSDTFTVKVTSNDTTAGYIFDKLTSADNSIAITQINDGGNESIDIAVSEANVDHDALQNFVASEHIDHSSVQIATAADSGLSGGGDITATRNLAVDITGTTSEASPADADEILVYDVSASALRKMTRGAFVGAPGASAGDLSEASFSIANNQSLAADVTGFAFANATVRSFDALVSVSIDAGSDLFESFRILGIQRSGTWDITVESVGDDSLIVFSITASGQITYTSAAYAGFVSGTLKYRAFTLTV